MKQRSNRWGAWIVVGVLPLVASWPAHAAGGGRFAVVAGNNDGGIERPTLQYAEDDARRVADVLRTVGGLPEDHLQVFLGKGTSELLNGVQRALAAARQENSGDGALLIFFYSGHSDGQDLLLGQERLSIRELKQSIGTDPNNVVLMILDACNAGAAIRTKGGRSAPSFMFFDELPRARGRIILTSTSESELAQESDEIGSSFFTHYLVSGLMGEADDSGDRRVSLAEVYRYVYDRTVDRTLATLPGVQHPGFSYDLTGEGGILLTDLNSGATGIVLPEESAGSYLLFDRNRRTVVAEVEKKPGGRRLIPVLPGSYTLKKRIEDHLLVAEVTVPANLPVTMNDNEMRVVAFESPTSKGWDLELRNRPSRWEVQAVTGWTTFARAPAGGVWTYPSVGMALRRARWPTVNWSARWNLWAGTWENSLPVQGGRIPFTLVSLGTDLSLGRVFQYGPLQGEIGSRATFLFLDRRFDTSGFDGGDQTLGAGLSGYSAVALRLGGIRTTLELSGGALAFPGADRVIIPAFSAAVGVGFGL